jgi:hypothetical protein
MGKNEDAWDVLFEKHNILDSINSSGQFEITSAQINELRESRLMTKFDHRANLPDIFRKNNLAILPVTRGSYVIGTFEAYASQRYNDELKPIELEFPPRIESLSPTHIFSEAAAINCAFISGMMEELLEAEIRPTISGRMSSSKFDFTINSISLGAGFPLSVDNCQCEIDGGFEGDDILAIVEAKNAISEDFIIRQLYYPYRLWSQKIRKRVVPIFLSYSNDIFHFFVYQFSDDGHYNSLNLVHQKNFIFAPERIELEDIHRILEQAIIVREPEEPFPQADNFARVVDLLSLLAGGETEAASITRNYDFDPRQTSYYTSAGKYLGLIAGKSGHYGLSKEGGQIMRLSYKSKYLALAEKILAHEVFNKTARLYLDKAERPSRDEVIEIMKSCRLRKVESDATYRRRAQSVIAWIEWIFGLQA